MRIRIRHLGLTTSRSQDHSGGTRIDPPRIGSAAIRRPAGTLVPWSGDDLGQYLAEAKHLAILENGANEGDGWSSSVIQRYKFERGGQYLVSTEHSRYLC